MGTSEIPTTIQPPVATQATTPVAPQSPDPAAAANFVGAFGTETQAIKSQNSDVEIQAQQLAQAVKDQNPNELKNFLEVAENNDIAAITDGQDVALQELGKFVRDNGQDNLDPTNPTDPSRKFAEAFKDTDWTHLKESIRTSQPLPPDSKKAGQPATPIVSKFQSEPTPDDVLRSRHDDLMNRAGTHKKDPNAVTPSNSQVAAADIAANEAATNQNWRSRTGKLYTAAIQSLNGLDTNTSPGQDQAEQIAAEKADLLAGSLLSFAKKGTLNSTFTLPNKNFDLKKDEQFNKDNYTNIPLEQIADDDWQNHMVEAGVHPQYIKARGQGSHEDALAIKNITTNLSGSTPINEEDLQTLLGPAQEILGNPDFVPEVTARVNAGISPAAPVVEAKPAAPAASAGGSGGQVATTVTPTGPTAPPQPTGQPAPVATTTATTPPAQPTTQTTDTTPAEPDKPKADLNQILDENNIKGKYKWLLGQYDGGKALSSTTVQQDLEDNLIPGLEQKIKDLDYEADAQHRGGNTEKEKEVRGKIGQKKAELEMAKELLSDFKDYNGGATLLGKPKAGMGESQADIARRLTETKDPKEREKLEFFQAYPHFETEYNDKYVPAVNAGMNAPLRAPKLGAKITGLNLNNVAKDKMHVLADGTTIFTSGNDYCLMGTDKKNFTRIENGVIHQATFDEKGDAYYLEGESHDLTPGQRQVIHAGNDASGRPSDIIAVDYDGKSTYVSRAQMDFRNAEEPVFHANRGVINQNGYRALPQQSQAGIPYSPEAIQKFTGPSGNQPWVAGNDGRLYNPQNNMAQVLGGIGGVLSNTGYPNAINPAGNAYENFGPSPNMAGLDAFNQSCQNNMWNQMRKDKKQRLLDLLLHLLARETPCHVGVKSPLYGPEYFHPPIQPGFDPGGSSFSMNTNYVGQDFALGGGLYMDNNGNWATDSSFANQNAAINVGADSNDNFRFDGAYQNEDFGVGLSFGKGGYAQGPYPGGEAYPPPFVGGLVLDFETILVMIMAILEEDEDEKIANIIRKMKKAAENQKGVTQNDLKKSPGYLQGENTETAILQAQLTMAVQRRQQMIDMINNAIKSAADAKHNAIRRMV